MTDLQSCPPSRDGLLSGAARLAGVVGSPIRHSLSPRLHGAWIRALALDAVYAPLPVHPDDFDQTVPHLGRLGFRGINVTLPFKERALKLADSATERARRAGAANVLLFEPDGGVIADNTYGEGLLYALHRQAQGWRADLGPITILGAGGAARGAVAALAAAGATDIRILNRTRARADALTEAAPCTAFSWDRAAAAFDGAATVINATSGQLTGDAPLPLPPASDPPIVVMDMVYKPLITPFLAAARSAGHRVVDGLDMLIGQAAPAFEAFYGAPPPPIDIRAVLLDSMTMTVETAP